MSSKSSACKTSKGRGKLLQVTPWKIRSLRAMVRSDHSCNNKEIRYGTRGSDWDQMVTKSEATKLLMIKVWKLEASPTPGRSSPKRKVLLCKEYLACYNRRKCWGRAMRLTNGWESGLKLDRQGLPSFKKSILERGRMDGWFGNCPDHEITQRKNSQFPNSP